MALGGEIDDRIDGILRDHRFDELGIADVAALEPITRIAFDVGGILEVSRVGQLVDVEDRLLGVAGQLVADEIRADKSAATGDNQPLHVSRTFDLGSQPWLSGYLRGRGAKELQKNSCRSAKAIGARRPRPIPRSGPGCWPARPTCPPRRGG